MDPTRIEPSKKKVGPEETLEGNVENLIELMTIITDCIYASAPKIPKTLRNIFHGMQVAVTEKFPNDPMTRYTSVSGFIFLRFFAPAILGPHLFGLKIGNANTF